MTRAQLPDPAASRAVLVGVSRYARMPENRQLPAVENNLRRLAALLNDPRIWGLPTEHCVVLHQPEDADYVISTLRTAAQQTTAALLFYYAGHGLVDPYTDDELHLALPGSREPAGTHLALRYQHVRAEMLRAVSVPQKVVILDCCWSGKVLIGTAMGTDDLAAVAAVQGTAVLTACASTVKALSPAGEPCTAFTGTLAAILDEGIPGGPRELDVGTLYRSLAQRLRGRNHPHPQLGTSGSGSEMVLARNTCWREEPGAGNALAPGARPAPVGTGPVGPVQTGPAGADARLRIRELMRCGRYAEAYELRLRLAEAGDADAARELVTQLRREGRYRSAAELERTVPGSEAARQLLRRLRQDSPDET